MRPSTLARGGALLTAAALAFTLGSGPASASDSHDSVGVGSAAAPARHGKLATHFPGSTHGTNSPQRKSASVHSQSGTGDTPQVTKVSASSTVLWDPEGSSIDVDVYLTGDQENISELDVNLTVGGVHAGAYPVYYDEETDTTYINIPNSVGTGKAKITSEKIQFTEGSEPPTTTDSTDSNYFYVRRYTTSAAKYALTFSASKTHVNFHAQKWIIFRPSSGEYVAMNSIKLQYRLHHKWVTLKTIKLDSEGSGRYTANRSSKHNYRLEYHTTDTIKGSYTQATGNI